MTRLESRARLFACLLSALAGFVDAIGFIQSGGFFVSFMSGNSTRLAVGTVEAVRDALVAGAIILCFLGGVVGGTLLGSRFEARGRPPSCCSSPRCSGWPRWSKARAPSSRPSPFSPSRWARRMPCSSAAARCASA